MTVNDIHNALLNVHYFRASIFWAIMASPPSCCGCGVLGLKSGERRSVNNSPVVMHVWRTCLEEIGINFNDFSGKELTMCRKCFSAYERLHSLKKSVADKLAHAMSASVPDDIASVSKRPRRDAPVSASTSSSPDVAVSLLLLKNCSI